MSNGGPRLENGHSYRRAICIVVPIFVAICTALSLSEQLQVRFYAYDGLEHPYHPADVVNAAAANVTMTIADLFVPRDHDTAAAAQSDASEGALTLALRLRARRFVEPPPAALPVASDEMARRDPIASGARLEIETPEGIPGLNRDETLVLTIATAIDERSVDLTGFPEVVDLIVDPAGKVAIRSEVRKAGSGFFGLGSSVESSSKVMYVSASELRRPGGLSIEIPDYLPIDKGAEPAKVSVRLRLRDNAQEARILRASAGDGVALLDCLPGAEEGYATRILVPAAGSLTYALVWRGLPSPPAEARRADGGPPIGAEMPGLPLFAAAADGWASLRLVLRSDPRDEPVSFRVLAASGDSGAAESLFVSFVTTQLSQLTYDGAPLTPEQTREVTVWASRALGIERSRDALLPSLPSELSDTLRLAFREVERP